MPAFFSGTDDKYELGDPGIHLVVGGIKEGEMKYEIAASVVGSGRRFTMTYSNLIDATPVEGVTFHPKVLDYVDHTTKPTYTSKSNKTYKKYSGITTGKEYNSYQQWLKQYSSYGDIDDPYFYSDTYWGWDNNQKTETSNKELKLWEVEDLCNDYLNQNQNSVNKLVQLKTILEQTLSDVEVAIELNEIK